MNRWLVVVIAAIALGMFLSGCGSKEQKVESFIKKGNALLSKGDATRAILEYKNALQLDPKNVNAMYALGKAFMAQKDYRKAYGAFRSAVDTDPQFDKARIEVASLLSLAKRGKMALDEVAAIKHPDLFEPRLSIIKARALIAQKKFDEAVRLLMSIKDRGKNKDAQVLLSICYKEQGKKPAMMDAVNKWRKIDSKDPTSYIFMAQYYLEQGRREKASTELALMVKANPKNTKLKLFRAQALERLGLIDEAKKAYEGLPADPDMLKAQAGFMVRQKDYSNAKALLGEVLTKNPKDVQGVVQLAEVLAAEGKISEALARLKGTSRKGLTRDDAEKLTLTEATLYARQGEFKKAKELCNRVLKESQGNMDAHLLYGKILLGENDLENAEVHLKQVAVSRPNNVDSQILLARCQMLNKKEASAGDTLKKALKNNPGNRKLRLELVRYFLGKKEYDQAIAVLDRGLTIVPNDLTLLKTKGEIEAFVKKYEKALACFKAIIEAQPRNPLGYMEMGRLMIAQKKYDDAIGWFKKAYGAQNGWLVAVPALVQVYYLKGDADSALEVVKKEAAKRPGSALAHYYLGRTFQAKRNYAAAEKELTKASQLAPEWAEAYRALAETYLKDGKIAEAVRQVEEVYKRSHALSVGLNLAVLYEYQGNYKKAADIYTSLLQKHKKSPVLLNNLAYLYAEYSDDQKELEKAAEMIAEALALKPGTPNFLDTAAWIAYKRGKLNVAWNYIQDALEKGSGNGIIELHAAILAHDIGKTDLAKSHLEKAMEEKLDQRTREEALKLKKRWGL